MADISEIKLGSSTYSVKDTTARSAIKDIVSVASGTTTLTASVGKYYVVAGTVTSLAVTLPTITDNTTVKSFMILFTTGSSFSSFFLTPPSGVSIQYYADYEIEPSKTYELNCLYNGTKWIIAYGVLG